ncbi:hypothetical protein [Bradyrhizobium sp. USDA 4502]
MDAGRARSGREFRIGRGLDIRRSNRLLQKIDVAEFYTALNNESFRAESGRKAKPPPPVQEAAAVSLGN